MCGGKAANTVAGKSAFQISGSCDRSPQRANRIPPKSLLKVSRNWITNPRDSSARSRHGLNSIDDFFRFGFKPYLKNLFAHFCVIGQSSIGKSKARSGLTIADAVDHAASVQRPESHVMNEHADASSWFELWICLWNFDQSR